MTMSLAVTDWLSITTHCSQTRKYWHYLIKENLDHRDYIFDQIKDYVSEAHEDARRFWLGATVSLDPLEQDIPDELSGYPSLLPLNTLKGYFGEVFAALVAEIFTPFGEEGWKVPAHLFRWHNIAFEYLEGLRQDAEEKQSVFGRTGDDCLAFQVDSTGNVIKVLYCEAKCTNTHDTDMIKDAHKKAGNSKLTSLIHLIQLLSSRQDHDSRQWAEALHKVRLKISDIQRYDLVCYVCGQHPKREDTWMPKEMPHNVYEGGRNLQAVEVHLHDIDDLVRAVYCKANDESANTNN